MSLSSEYLKESIGLGFNEFAEANRSRCEESYHPVDVWGAVEWALAVAGETGEMCNQVKKIHRGDFNNDQEALDKALKDVGYEIADIVIYADLLATRMGFKLGDLIREKFNLTSDKLNSKIKL